MQRVLCHGDPLVSIHSGADSRTLLRRNSRAPFRDRCTPENRSAVDRRKAGARSNREPNRGWISTLRKATKNTLVIGGLGKFGEVQVRNRQVVFNPPHFGGNDAKGTARLRVQVHNKNRLIGMCERKPIDDENKRVVRAWRKECEQLLRGDPGVRRIADKVHVGSEFPDGFANGGTNRLPGGGV